MMRAIAELTRPYGVPTVRLAQRDHARRDRDVRRLPRPGRRQDASTPASTGPSSTPTQVDFRELADRLSDLPRLRGPRARGRPIAGPPRGGRGAAPRADRELPDPGPRRGAERQEAAAAAGEPGVTDQPTRPPRAGPDASHGDRIRAASTTAHPEGADGDRAAPTCPSRTPSLRAANFREVNLGLHPAARGPRGRALPPVQEPGLHRRLPRPGQHPAFIELLRDRRHGRRGRVAPRRQRAALRDRPGLPAGDPVRGRLRPGQEGLVGRDRRPGALRRRLGDGAPGGAAARRARRRPAGRSRSSAPARPA